MKLTLKEIEEHIEEIFLNKKKNKSMIAGTGKGGAAMFHANVIRSVNPEMTDKEFNEIKQRYQKTLRDGYYEFSDFGVEYKGMSDNRKDGIYIAKVDDEYFIDYVKNKYLYKSIYIDKDKVYTFEEVGLPGEGLIKGLELILRVQQNEEIK